MTTQDRKVTMRAQLRAAIVATAPVVLLAGFVYHPQIGNFTDPGFLAALSAAVAADPTRWYFSHLTIVVGSGLLMVAFLAIRSYLREAGEERWSVPALPFIVMGSTLFVMPPTFEISTLAAAEAGADVQAFQAALIPRVAPSLLTAAALFALGAIGFSMGIARSGALTTRLRWLAAGGLVLMAASRFVPLEIVQFYVQGVAGIVALWPLALVMWRHPGARPAGQQRPMSAT